MSGSSDPVAAFQDAMAQFGIVSKQPIRANGRLNRFHVEGEGKGTKTGFYTLHLDGRPAGMFGCWKRGIKETWKANGAPLSDFDIAKLSREIEVERKRREREEAKRHKGVADDAARLWASYEPAPIDHPYLLRKHVQPHGARVEGQNRLVVSVNDAAGAIWSLQTIDADGGKLFMTGGKATGGMYMIGEPGDRIVIAEGFATGASIHEATGLGVVVAFNAGNLEPVAQAIRARWPKAQIVIAADDDSETTDNPGVRFARKAAETVGGMVAIPARNQPDGKKLDFNDLAVAEGLEAVAAIVLRTFPEPDAEPEPDEERHAEQPAEAEPIVDAWKGPLAQAIAELNETYFVAPVGGSARVASSVNDEAMNRERLVFSRETDIKLLFAHRHYVTGISRAGNEIWKGLGEAWLNHAQRRTYRQIALIPTGPCPDDVYNLWRGFGVQPQAGGWATLKAHLLTVVCSGKVDDYDWLINWLAYCVQHPGKQAEVAVVLRGLKGTGKGMVGQMLMRIFRNHALQITNSKHMVGNFNAHLVDTLFLFLDEAYWAGDKQGEGTLKALITERTLMIEPKGVDSFQMPNRLKILMASNNDWVVPVTAEERRYFVLDVADTRKGDKAYFTKLAAAVDGDELSAFLDYLLKLDLAKFDHRNPPHTDGLNKQKLIGANSLTQFWFDCLSHGEIVGTSISEWPEDIVVQVLHGAYCEFAGTHGDRYPMTDARMAMELAGLLPDGEPMRIIRPRGRPFGETERPNRYVLPSLATARLSFLSAMRIEDSYIWPVVEEGS